jgi:hypothetical protein
VAAAAAVRAIERLRGVGRVRVNSDRLAIRVEPCLDGILPWRALSAAVAEQGLQVGEMTVTATGRVCRRRGGPAIALAVGTLALIGETEAVTALAGVDVGSRALVHGLLGGADGEPVLRLRGFRLLGDGSHR